MSDYKFHKYADLYPIATEEELQRLTEDIKKNGLANPITLHEGQILDGRNRYIACQIAKVKPDFQNWDCIVKSWANGEKDVLLWVISQNSYRRHLSTSQLATVAAKVAEIFQEDAKKRELAGVKTDASNPRAILPQGKSTDLAAKTVGGVSGRTVRDAVKVQKDSPELAAKVLKGDITVAEAKKQLPPAPPKDSKPQKVKKVLPPLPVPEPIPEDIAVPNPKTLKVLDEIERHLKEAQKLAQHCEGVRIHSVKEYERLDQVQQLADQVRHKLYDGLDQTPEKHQITAMLRIRNEKLCDPKWKIGDIVFYGYTPNYKQEMKSFKSLLAPFRWRNTAGDNFIKERTFATKDDPQPDPPNPPESPAPKHKRKRPEKAAA